MNHIPYQLIIISCSGFILIIFDLMVCCIDLVDNSYPPLTVYICRVQLCQLYVVSHCKKYDKTNFSSSHVLRRNSDECWSVFIVRFLNVVQNWRTRSGSGPLHAAVGAYSSSSVCRRPHDQVKEPGTCGGSWGRPCCCWQTRFHRARLLFFLPSVYSRLPFFLFFQFKHCKDHFYTSISSFVKHV